MSRIGERPIDIPKGVELKVTSDEVTVKGAKGALARKIHPEVVVKHDGDQVFVSLRNNIRENRRFHGLMRTLINNMVVGVTQGFTKELVMIGVGYRATMKGKVLHLSLGYSHPVEYEPLAGVELKVGKQNDITVSGADREHVGQVAAVIRGFRKPEPYHGKGVRYKDEVIATKVGKSSGRK